MGFKVAIAQMSFNVDDLFGNADKIVKAIHQAKKTTADLIVFPELSVTGYPPEDLLLRRDYCRSVMQVIAGIIAEIPQNINVIFGTPYLEKDQLFNAAIHATNNGIAHIYYKRSLPNYQVFDEKRYFQKGNENCVFELKGHKLGLTICEDIWDASLMSEVKQAGAECVINISASPFDISKQANRQHTLNERYKETSLPLIYVNLVGAQDELVFDGNSAVMGTDGDFIYEAPPFEEVVGFCEPFIQHRPTKTVKVKYEPIALIHRALLTGLKTYVDRNNFRGLVIGISGGIDSAVSAALAVDAVGSENVKGVMMPSQYTSSISIEDTEKLAKSLHIELLNLSISETFESLKLKMGTAFEKELKQLASENLQARIRACLLMTVSNQYNLMVVSTSNKSEISVGYTTLYGDMIGGYAPLKDLYKTQVYELSHYYNRAQEVIPQRIIERPPSAELSDNQKDSDSLPPYELLDPILDQLIEQDASLEDLINDGFPEAVVHKVSDLVARSEYKRRQSIPGVKVSLRAFGKERRYPLNYRFNYTK